MENYDDFVQKRLLSMKKEFELQLQHIAIADISDKLTEVIVEAENEIISSDPTLSFLEKHRKAMIELRKLEKELISGLLKDITELLESKKVGGLEC